jgi:thioesterase domain-containing protein
MISAPLPSAVLPAAPTALGIDASIEQSVVDRARIDGPPRAAPHEAHTHLEVQLAGVWAEMLKAQQLGLDEDFFDLGGDSLLATEMLHRVQQDCGCRIDASRVLSGLTVRRLAAAILDGSRASFSSPVVQIQKGDGRVPFFFLHNDAVSGGFYCRRIARGIGAEVPVYAVQPHGLKGFAFRDSIEEMAAERVASILELRPEGPYRIGGFCGGGLVAYEMARQLTARGHVVERLLLIDTIAPATELRPAWRLVEGAGTLLRLSPRTQRELFRRVTWYREELRSTGRAGPVDVARWLGAKLGRKIAGILAPGVRADQGRLPQPAGEPLQTTLWRQFHLRRTVYVPQGFAGRLALFRSSFLDSERARGTEDRWRGLSTGIDVHPIPGDHFTCVTTHAAVLAASMRPYLRD